MKKFLLGTTALISLSAASAAMAGGSHTPAAAEPANTGGLTVLVGGTLDFQSVFRNEDRETGGNNEKNEFFRNDTVLNFTAAGSTDSFDYGAVIELVADANQDKNGTDGGRKTYLYVENDSFGRVEGGMNVGASSTLEVDASTIARGTGGVDGDIFYNMDTSASNGSYITSPNLPTADEETDEGNANKLTYYTPRFSGVQFGVSFTPDTGNRGSATSISFDDDFSDYSNVFAGGVNFQSDVADGVGIMASAVAEFGTAEGGSGTALTNDDLEDLSAYSLGLGFEFEGFSVAGNYADLGDSGQDTTPTAGSDTDQAYYTLGAAYENGAYGVSVTYLNSQAGNAVDPTQNELSNLVIGADYQMAPGLTPYIEYANFELDEQGTANDSDGSVVLVGAELSF